MRSGSSDLRATKTAPTKTKSRVNLGFRSKIWINEDLIPGKIGLSLGARRRYRAGKIAKNWTYQGDIYIALLIDPTPIKISCESDFPAETQLKDGEGMLPKEIPLRRAQINRYQGRNMNTGYNYYNNNQMQPQMNNRTNQMGQNNVQVNPHGALLPPSSKQQTPTPQIHQNQVPNMNAQPAPNHINYPTQGGANFQGGQPNY